MKVISIAPLKKVVPEWYYPSMLNSVMKCPLRGLFTNDVNKAYIFADSINKEMGMVMHIVLEKGLAGDISNKEDFSALWMEAEHQVIGGTLKYRVKNYARYRYQAMQILWKKQVELSTSQKKRIFTFLPERKMKSTSAKLRGRPDLLVLKHGKPYEIKDYKTGQIFRKDIPEYEIPEAAEAYLSIKDEYKDQLLYYAVLVKEEYKCLPEVLTIISTSGISVSYRCQQKEVAAAVVRFDQLKNNLKDLPYASLARPTEDNCRFCNYKPGCAFRVKMKPQPFGDISGKVTSVVIHPYGNYTIRLKSGENIIQKNPESMFPEIENLVGKNIYLNNVCKIVSKSEHYIINDSTVLYILNENTDG